MKSILKYLIAATFAGFCPVSLAEVMNVHVSKEIDDDNIIVITAKGDKLLLEKWSLKFSPLLFEGKTFPADVSPIWVTMYVAGKGEIKWSIEEHLGTVDLSSDRSSVASDKSLPSASERGYEIEVAHNDELFIVNGERYEAQTYCLGWEAGERVIFVEGSAFGACATATLLNLNRNQTCEVWCE